MSESINDYRSFAESINKKLVTSRNNLVLEDPFNKTEKNKFDDFTHEKIEFDDDLKLIKPNLDTDNIYDIKSCRESKILKEDIILKSEKYPTENIEKINTNPNSDIRTLSFQYVIDNPEFLTKNHKYIKDLHKYLGDIVDNFEKKKEISDKKFNLMPNELSIYTDYSQGNKVLDTYEELIEAKTNKIKNSYQGLLSNIAEPINNQINELVEEQNNQLKIYQKNFEFMKKIINLNFIDSMNYPDEFKILEELKDCNTPKELENQIEIYLKQLNSIENNNITEFILSLDNLMKKNVMNPPEFKFPEWFENESEEIRDYVNNKLMTIKKRLLKDFRNNNIYDFEQKSKKSNFNRNLNSDSTTGFIKFNEYHKFKLRLTKKLGADNQQRFSTLCNIENKFMACGSKEGSIYIYNLQKNKLSNIFVQHDDEITSLIKFKFKKENQDPELLLVSGGGQLDKDIYIWKLTDRNPIIKLTGNNSGIVSIIDMQDYRSILSIGFDGLLLLFDVKKGEIAQKLNLNDYPTMMKLANNNSKLVVSFANSKISVLNFNKNYYDHDIPLITIEHNFELESMAYNLLSFQINIDKILITTKQGNLIILDTVLGKYEIKKDKYNYMSDSCLIENGKVAFDEEFFIINSPKTEESFNLFDDENILKGVIQPNIIPKPKTQLIKISDIHLQFASININGKIDIFDII